MSLSHVDAKGRPKMVDISTKSVSSRQAHARAKVLLPAEVARQFVDNDLLTRKGSVIHTAVIAGTMAVKRTADLIPFCHPLPIDRCDIQIELQADNQLVIDCIVAVQHKTGVEMEALTGASVAALTVYDMLKALSHDMQISEVRLVSKQGGKSDYQAGDQQTSNSI